MLNFCIKRIMLSFDNIYCLCWIASNIPPFENLSLKAIKFLFEFFISYIGTPSGSSTNPRFKTCSPMIPICIINEPVALMWGVETHLSGLNWGNLVGGAWSGNFKVLLRRSPSPSPSDVDLLRVGPGIIKMKSTPNLQFQFFKPPPPFVIFPGLNLADTKGLRTDNKTEISNLKKNS